MPIMIWSKHTELNVGAPKEVRRPDVDLTSAITQYLNEKCTEVSMVHKRVYERLEFPYSERIAIGTTPVGRISVLRLGDQITYTITSRGSDADPVTIQSTGIGYNIVNRREEMLEHCLSTDAVMASQYGPKVLLDQMIKDAEGM